MSVDLSTHTNVLTPACSSGYYKVDRNPRALAATGGNAHHSVADAEIRALSARQTIILVKKELELT